ncbi:heparin lyase I family protein [Gephyromycinifex aptenodytis]|uniref:heparin lyase I family protein n=1 Tax=Gephyromycinifex aptenodytis TaxID=2716227 RepID=UPI001447E88D|nr:heparin lyase I family protein [Gephyromycinifex aptenodytis]
MSDPSVTYVSCGGEGDARRAHTQENGEPPICYGSSWNFVLPADPTPAPRRRSEVFVSQGREPRTYRPGDEVHFAATITGFLGAAADTTTDWHVLWQVLGQTNGQWKGPSMALIVADGRLALSGGNGHPEHGEGNSYQWNRLITPYRDGTPYRIEIDSRLDAEDGWVTVRLDGETVLDRYRPRTAEGKRLGTVYPGQDELTERYGLYRGSDAKPPAYAQMVRQDVVEE